MERGNFIYKYPLFLCKMILEEVLPHPHREEIYINHIVTPHNEVKESDKNVINQILLTEVARESIEISN